jgi:DNA-binding LacI/PurR family transcriptional regulator
MITIKDIAREAGVSHPTVSLVLNGKAKQLRISDAVSERIKIAAIKLGYQRNEIARSMVTGKSNVLGLLLPETTREYCAKIINGVMKTASEYGRYIKVIYVGEGSSIENIVGQCVGQRVDAVICYGLDNKIDMSLFHKLLFARKIPLCVIASCRSFGAGIHVTPDDELGGKLVFNYLYELGHRRFLIPFDYNESSWAKLRLNGFRKTAMSMGVKIGKKQIVQFHGKGKGIFSVETVKKIFSDKNHPSAIFCLYDDMALHLMTMLQFIGIRVPEDVSIVGYGNMSYGTRCVPSLTTVEENLEDIGRKSIELLLGEIKEKKMDSILKETLILGKVKLIARDSTRAFAISSM